jgi:hypothetical protein
MGRDQPQAVLQEVLMKTADVLETAAEATTAPNCGQKKPADAG